MSGRRGPTVPGASCISRSTSAASRVVQLAIRQRSARVQILQEVLDRMRQVIVARAFQYADDPV